MCLMISKKLLYITISVFFSQEKIKKEKKDFHLVFIPFLKLKILLKYERKYA